jgi:cob(I)alamin adenosyltransferase
VIEIEKKKGILNSIRYFLAPKDLFENIQKLEQEIMDLKVEKNTELKFTRQLLEVNEKKIKERELLIDELKKELSEIKVNAPAKLEEERKRKQSENVHTILNPKQLDLFKILSQGEKTYLETLESARNSKLDIRDMATLRVQISRLNRKLRQETHFKVERIQRNDCFYYKIG